MSSPPEGERPDLAGVGPSSPWDQPAGDPRDLGHPHDLEHPRFADDYGTAGWPDGSVHLDGPIQPGGPNQPGGWPQPQPGGAGATPAADRPIRTYLWQSLVATLLCCLPTGIVAIVYATQTQTRLQAGDFAGARAASGRARRWCIISLIAFVVVLLVYIVAIVIVVAIVSRND